MSEPKGRGAVRTLPFPQAHPQAPGSGDEGRRHLKSAPEASEEDTAIAEVRAFTEILTGSPQPRGYLLRAPRPGDMGWVVQRNGAIYAEEFGWDASYEALVARIVAGYVENRDPDAEAAWIAVVDGTPAGCVF